jgi:1,4-alpha-glucan branching enzyme
MAFSGKIVFVLHAHLPFVRHPAYSRFLEEDWLFEAITETYLPLLRVLRNLHDDGIPVRIGISVSPTLVAMLEDSLLQERYLVHLDRLLELSAKECERTRGDVEFEHLAKMYDGLFRKNREDFVELYEKNILKGFGTLARQGCIELFTTAATHSYLPLYQQYPETVDAQIALAVSSHRRAFGMEPHGMWLPECGYYEGLERRLAKHGISYFFTAAHGVLFGSEPPKYGVYSPVRTPAGPVVFPRDLASANAVWSSDVGYPGDPVYREYYRDIGFDLPMDYIGPYIHPDGIRINTGMKYYRITDRNSNKKEPYNPERAMQRVREHAHAFVNKQQQQVQLVARFMDREPVISCPYDAELFGHWWFEGPAWLDQVARLMASDSIPLSLAAPSDLLEDAEKYQELQPAFSSWGNKGYSEVWLDGSNDWIYRHIHKAIERMHELAQRFPDEDGMRERALNQAARELLLVQASDWPFIMRAGHNCALCYEPGKRAFTEFYPDI